MALRRTSTRLADGRELIYFDDVSSTRRDVADPRELPPATTHSQLRRDPLLDEWVIIASHRQARTFQPPTDQCPLCPSTRGRQTEIPADSYDIVVFDNRFPSLSADARAASYDDGVFVARPGIGSCEVVCFTSDHNSSFAKLSPERAAGVVEVWQDRMMELSRRPGVEYVYPFENRGREIGVTLAHPHGQIYAYPFVPPPVRRSLQVAGEHREQTGRCLFCDVLAAERADHRRVVAEGEHWTAYVPHAARWPFEVHLVTHRHLPDLPALTTAERDDFALLYLDVLRRFDALFDTATPYIAAWVQAPVHADRELSHLYLKLFTIRRAADKLKYLAGSESGMGVFVGDIQPEQAAATLRGD